jgi:hypothetical protein
MEIRLIINGNLVQTMVLPKLALICSKVTTLQSHYVNAISFYFTHREEYPWGAIYNLHNINNEYNIKLMYVNHGVLNHFHLILSHLDLNVYIKNVLTSFSVNAIPQNK